MQVVLHGPLAAWRGDRVILRDASASRTIAGGRILDPFAPARYRRTPQRMTELDALALDDAHAREEAIITTSPFGADLSRLRRAAALASDDASVASSDGASPLFEGLLHAKDGSALWVLHEQFAGLLRADALGALARYHEAHPDELGPDAARLRRLAAPRLQESLWRALLGRLQAQGAIAQRGSFVHLPEHGVRLSAVDERIAQKIAPMLAAAGFEGAWARDLARDAGESEPLMRVAIARLAQRGDVHQVVRDLVYDSATLRRLAAIVREEAGQYDGVVTAARFRDATALGRKRAIQILEYFDRAGVLRRVGDEHRLRTDSRLFVD
jgi:selenocysteine-specific elongation factor